MKNSQWFVALNTLLLVIFYAFVSKGATNTEGKNINDGKCTTFSWDDIPIGAFGNEQQMPEDESILRITQTYNTSKSDGFYHQGTLYYGHDGLDIHELGAPSGKNNVYAVQPGLVIVSENNGGWGESIIIATRANKFSEEIITTHYHHLHYQTPAGGGYVPTRRFNACEEVWIGEVLAKEGGSGGWPTHLHFGVRRWSNIHELKNAINTGGASIYGYGYTFGNNSRIEKHLNPLVLMYHSFSDYQYEDNEEPSYAWSLPYITSMQEQGIEFGLFNGKYGAGETVTREELVRWLKIAAELVSFTPPNATFDDVGIGHKAFPYVEAMSQYPQALPVVNPDNSCKNPGHNFCPDKSANRAEALKMVIMTFYPQEYLEYYKTTFWNSNPFSLVDVLSIFEDVSIVDWYAPFVAFSVENNLVTSQAYFKPGNTVKREEAAKWIIKGIEHIEDLQNSWCNTHNCDQNYFCSDLLQICVEIPLCLSNENQVCPAGGGYNPCNNPNCQPGQTLELSCNNGQGIMISQCTQECQWGDWSSCNNNTSGNSGGNGGNNNSSGCIHGEVEEKPCNGGLGYSMRTCEYNGVWGPWSPCIVAEFCNPGDAQYQLCNNATGTKMRICNEMGQWDPWGPCVPNGSDDPTCECSNGPCCDGCNYLPASHVCNIEVEYQCEGSGVGKDPQQLEIFTYCTGNSASCNGPTDQEGWEDIDNCSNQEECNIINNFPQCVPVQQSCEDTFTASDTEDCYNNPSGSGTPVLCLKLQQNSGSSWKYRICKEGGPFQNSFTYQLHDQNHLVFFNTYNGNSGTTCTPWHNFDIGYVTQNGAVNGAGLRAKVLSPAGCNQNGCTYWTGGITISKNCD